MCDISVVENFVLREKWTEIHQNPFKTCHALMPLIMQNYIVFGQTIDVKTFLRFFILVTFFKRFKRFLFAVRFFK